MIPKVKTSQEIKLLDDLLSEKGHNCRLHIIIEPNSNGFDKYIIHEIIKQYAETYLLNISKKKNKWLKIKIKEDNYQGYIQRKNYSEYLKPSHKINKLSAKIYKLPNKKTKINELTFGSKIKIIDKKNQF